MKIFILRHFSVFSTSLLFVFFILTGGRAAAASISTACHFLLGLESAGLSLDGSVKLIPQAAISVPDMNYMPHYTDAMIVYTESEIPQLAKTLASGMGEVNSEVVASKLRTAKEKKDSGISIKEILPARITEKLGELDCSGSSFCYRAAMNFHLPLEFKDNPQSPSPVSSIEYVFSRYRNLSRSDKLQFGDLIVFYKRLPGKVLPVHVGIYLGGDLVYHKFGPDPRVPFEISTFEGITKHFQIASEKQINNFPGIDDWQYPISVLFTRYNGTSK